MQDAEAFGGDRSGGRNFSAGCFASSAMRRRTAFTSDAAEDFFARFTSSTDSFTAARAGILSQKSKLVEPHPQRERHRQIEPRDGLLQLPVEQKIEQTPPAQHAHSQLGRERRVFRLDVRAKLRVQHVARIRAFRFHAAQHLERDLSGLR